MKTPNTIEDDIDRIREKINEETKNLTSTEYADYFNKSAVAAFKRIGYEMVKINPQGHMKLVKIQPGM